VRIPTRILLILLLFTAIAPARVRAADDEALFDRLRETAAGVSTLRASFVQEKHLAMFREVLTSRGRFAFRKPDRLRWEVTEPSASGFVVAGRGGRRWRGTAAPEPFDLERDPLMKVVAGQLLAWATADFPALGREYRISVLTREPVTLRLDPLTPASGFLDYLLISFAPGGAHVSQVEIREKGGDFTRIRFLDTAVNPTLPADLF
jgi:outer membrane lipoprotein-sorting protein